MGYFTYLYMGYIGLITHWSDHLWSSHFRPGTPPSSPEKVQHDGTYGIFAYLFFNG